MSAGMASPRQCERLLPQDQSDRWPRRAGRRRLAHSVTRFCVCGTPHKAAVPSATDGQWGVVEYRLLWAERGRHPEFVFTFIARKTRTCPHTGQRYERGQRCPITYYGPSTQRRREWKKAGVDARFHDLRHTAGMRTLRGTGNLKTTQKLLGHTAIFRPPPGFTRTRWSTMSAPPWRRPLSISNPGKSPGMPHRPSERP
jgi:hypothetical protein